MTTEHPTCSPHTFPCMQEHVRPFRRRGLWPDRGPCIPAVFLALGVTGDGAPALVPLGPGPNGTRNRNGRRGQASGPIVLLLDREGLCAERVMVVIIYLRLAQALGGSSRVTGSHDSGGDGEGSGGGRPGELGDGLTKHLDSVDGCKEEGCVSGVED